MSHTIYAGKIAKRRNSTLQPTLNDTFNVLLKSPTSLHTPTFTISAATFDYNYLKWDDRYYFVTDVVSKNNSLWEVSAVCDVLATFKTDILASTQFVSYSNFSSGIWLPDTRIPTKSDIIVTKTNQSVSLFSLAGCYILTVIGQDGVESFNVNSGTIAAILADLATWTDNIQQAIENISAMTHNNDIASVIGFLGDLIREIGVAMVKTGFLGNSREEALNCIRSCVWLPFDSSEVGGATDSIYLGKYPTQQTGELVTNIPKYNTVSISIPWHFSDYRRSTNEDIYLYLPFIGNVALSSSSLTGESTLSITYAYCIDGSLTYEVKAGNQIIGTYGGNVAGNVPVGMSQVEGLGKIFTSLTSGYLKTLSAGVKVASGDLSGLVDVTPAGLALGAYEQINTAMTTHPGAVGGLTCGAAAGLDKDIVCYSVAHPTVIEPADMLTTMGRPTMKPLTLSSCSGYCQCANAHVAATGAEAEELVEIDAYLNGGFYIE